MNLSAFVLRIAFLALPGLAGFSLYRKLRGRPERQSWEDLAQVLFFSLASYLLLGLIWNPALSALQAFSDEHLQLDLKVIGLASIFGVLLALVASAAHRKDVIPRLARFMHISNRTGDEDLWEVFHLRPNERWIVIRDHELGLVYFGDVRRYSESGEERELIIEQVSVYRDNHDEEPLSFLYETPALYIQRDKNRISMEILSEERKFKGKKR